MLAWMSRVFWRALSIPIFFKVLGIGALVALLFGGVALLETREGMSRVLFQLLEQRARLVAHTIADGIERPMSTEDYFSVNEDVLRARETVPDIRYILALDPKGQVVAHTFEHAVPTDLLRIAREPMTSGEGVRAMDSAEGMILAARMPILNGSAGSLHLGMGNQSIATALSTLKQVIYRSLAISIVLGVLLALFLTHLLARPVHHLEETALRIREGAFEARARIFSADEIGHLAMSFNKMAESLQSYQEEVEEKERARAALIDRVVRTQEEERANLSRELHDHFGQSLLALLLAVQSNCKASPIPDPACGEIEEKLRGLVDEVHRLAWGMRPSILDDYGLNRALSRLVEETARNIGFEIDYHSTAGGEKDRPPSTVEVALYRVAQEAMANIVRHAGAKRASVVFLSTLEAYVLLVEDDGCGFEAMEPRDDQCLGLVGMRERAALLGGTVDIESSPGQGTTVRVKIPTNGVPKCQSES